MEINSENTDQKLRETVGNLLRIGVVSSVVLAVFGIVKLFLEGFEMPKNYDEISQSSENIWRDFWQSLLNFEGQGIILLSILILISTPVLRVVFSLIGYYKERDFLYVAISLIVLCIIAFSFFTGYG